MLLLSLVLMMVAVADPLDKDPSILNPSDDPISLVTEPETVPLDVDPLNISPDVAAVAAADEAAAAAAAAADAPAVAVTGNGTTKTNGTQVTGAAANVSTPVVEEGKEGKVLVFRRRGSLMILWVILITCLSLNLLLMLLFSILVTKKRLELRSTQRKQTSDILLSTLLPGLQEEQPRVDHEEDGTRSLHRRPQLSPCGHRH